MFLSFLFQIKKKFKKRGQKTNNTKKPRILLPFALFFFVFLGRNYMLRKVVIQQLELVRVGTSQILYKPSPIEPDLIYGPGSSPMGLKASPKLSLFELYASGPVESLAYNGQLPTHLIIRPKTGPSSS